MARPREVDFGTFKVSEVEAGTATPEDLQAVGELMERSAVTSVFTAKERIRVEIAERVPAGTSLAEAHRILRPTGAACHYIDLSDHFSHQDPSISSINFLRFDARQWDKIAGNKYAYLNRLRAPEYLDLFNDAGFDPVAIRPTVDEAAKAVLEQPFPLDQRFQDFSPDDLCTAFLLLLPRKKPQS